jgi:lipase chaperone LimK
VVAVAAIAAVAALALLAKPPVKPTAAKAASASVGAGAGTSMAEQMAGSIMRQPELPAPPMPSQVGTTADGSWSVSASGALVPNIALRRRFDYYLNALNETSQATVESIGANVLRDATRAVGAAAAARIMELWGKYVALQNYSFKTQVNLQDRATWQAALTERQLVRRQLLPLPWAEAFYRAEEDAFLAFIQDQSNGAKNLAKNQTDPTGDKAKWQATLEPDAQKRVASADDAWQSWERKLDAARAEHERLQQAPELSAVQREALFERYLFQHFDAIELHRARALLNLLGP